MNLRAQRQHVRLACISALWLPTILFVGLISPAPAQAPLHLHGHVRDTSGRSAQNATVRVEGSRGERTTASAADGRFDLDYPDPTSALTLPATTRTRSEERRVGQEGRS